VPPSARSPPILWGRKPAIIGASLMAILFGGIYPFIRDPALLPLVGFFLLVSIYILVALLFAIYIPELFPADVRMRAVGLCNTLGRTATIFTPFLVVFLFRMHGAKGVVILMNGLLVVQILLVVHSYGIEPRMRRLEEIQ
jgi:MFS transporter, putative metabolite:H+ symporter